LHVVDDERDWAAARKPVEKVEDAHREGEPVDVRVGTPDRSEQGCSLRLGERRQVTVQDLSESVSERRERELRLGCGRPAREDVPAATPRLFLCGRKQCRLSNAGLALQEESAGPLQARPEELPDRVQLGAPADDSFQCRCDRHGLDPSM
jgi:hypothetical protein